MSTKSSEVGCLGEESLGYYISRNNRTTDWKIAIP